MSVLVEKRMGELNEERKPVYPLFQKGARPRVVQPTEAIHPAIEGTAGQNASTSSLQNAPESIARKSKRPKTFNPVVDIDASTATSKPNSGDRAELLDVDPNSGRRKRRKTAENKVGTEGSEGSEGHTEAGRPVPKRQPRQKDLPGSVQNCPDLDSTANVQSVDIESEGDENHQKVFKQVGDAQGMHNAPKPERTRTLSDASEDLIGPPPIGTGAKCIKKSQLFRIEDLIGPPPITPGANSSTTSTEIPNEVRPKKILRLNPMTGTIGSPPAKKPLRALEPEGKKAPASKQKVKTKVVIIRYSHGKGIGQKIDRILHRTKLIISLPSKVLSETQKPPVSATKPPKTLHPLFLGKAAVKKGTTPPKPTLKGVIDLSCAQEPPRPRSRGKSSPTKPAPVTFSGFGAAKLMKYPGAIEPAWPWRDMVHIRGIDPNEVPPQSASTPLQTRSRKFKYQAIEVSPAESILGTLANELCIEKATKEIREINPDEYPPVPACLRIPSKHYELGLTIQRRVLKELHTRPVFPTLGNQSSTEDEIQTTKKARRPSCHAALLKVYASIPKSFSAFDLGQCENQAWIQKYAPKAAEEVLQAGSEARILKAWLQRLTVQSVEAGLGDQPESRAGRSKSSKSEKQGNRKRKSKKLDDFIVSTEDEDDDMDEVTESEDGASPNGKQDLLKKTVIRVGDAAALGSKESGKLTNATLISGPHGCGKTAAVYAVAKELGFEVFEINSSSRRSGRDILERVGDMARNHQVQRSSDVPTTDPIDDDKQRIDDALANDLQSGRQGTMNSFFKPKQETKPDTKPKPKTKTETQRRAATQKTLFSRRPAKQQKQSLILLEEVDILYKEDTQFWAQVVSLISMSKRPIIMTCNDESVLPITSLSLTFHAILRFAPPPIDLAIDHMLLVAACEGHVLRRESVKTLYEGRNSDLRASLTELQFWCQFAVGDVKRGLDWYYPRWSRREDIGEEGNTIRVVSEGTYETGMGWLSQDFLESDIHHLDVEEEMLHEVYDSWHADASNDAKYRTGMDRWAKKIQTLSSGRNDNKAALAMYADFAEAMSSADLCSGGIFAPDNRTALDSSLPELSQKAKDDYILAHDILEATPLVSYDNVCKDIYFWMQSRTRNYLQVDQHVKHNLEVPTELARPSERAMIRLITSQTTEPEASLNRKDLSRAFDPVAEPEKLWPLNPTAMELCSFDRTTALITEDLAPYIRSIVAYDNRLQQERAKLSNLLSEGGRPGKKLRTTRAAISALEGGTRKTTRRDRWFTGKVNTYHVMQTGMQSWLDAAAMETPKSAEDLTTSPVASPEETSDETCE